MKLEGKSDDGSDLRIGDIIYIKGKVTTKPDAGGDCKVRYYGRPGFDEYARPTIAAIFLRRSRWNWLRRIFPKKLERIETSPLDGEAIRKISLHMRNNGDIIDWGFDEFSSVELDHILDHVKQTVDYYVEMKDMDRSRKRVAPMPVMDPAAIVSIPGD